LLNIGTKCVFFEKKAKKICICSRNSLILQRFWNEDNMNYLFFRAKLLPLGCFSIEQIGEFVPDYDRNSITRWVKKGYLMKLRRGQYAFRESAQDTDFALMVAGQMVQPSYLSLQYALAHYGMIPAQDTQFTSVTTQKPAVYENALGVYSYRSIASHLYFGYQPHTLSNDRTYMLATPEKALLDTLYLHPDFATEEGLNELQLNDEYMTTQLDQNRLFEYLARWKSPALSTRVRKLLSHYDRRI
jgi:predicted transcriptional regulator of viral defense system